MEIYHELDEMTFAQMQLVDDELDSLKIKLQKLAIAIEELRVKLPDNWELKCLGKEAGSK